MVVPKSSPVKARHQQTTTVTRPDNAGSTATFRSWAFLYITGESAKAPSKSVKGAF